jgi:GTP-binding protein
MRFATSSERGSSCTWSTSAVNGRRCRRRSVSTIRAELTKYSPLLAEKEEFVVANKVDLTGGGEAAQALAEAIGKEVLPVSAVSGIGLAVMVERLWGMIRRAKEEATV